MPPQKANKLKKKGDCNLVKDSPKKQGNLPDKGLEDCDGETDSNVTVVNQKRTNKNLIKTRSLNN